MVVPPVFRHATNRKQDLPCVFKILQKGSKDTSNHQLLWSEIVPAVVAHSRNILFCAVKHALCGQKPFDAEDSATCRNCRFALKLRILPIRPEHACKAFMGSLNTYVDVPTSILVQIEQICSIPAPALHQGEQKRTQGCQRELPCPIVASPQH